MDKKPKESKPRKARTQKSEDSQDGVKSPVVQSPVAQQASAVTKNVAQPPVVEIRLDVAPTASSPPVDFVSSKPPPPAAAFKRTQKRQVDTFNAEGHPMTLIQSSHYFRVEDVYSLDSMRASARLETGDSGLDISALLRGIVSVVGGLEKAPRNSERGVIWQEIVHEALRLRNIKRPGRW